MKNTKKILNSKLAHALTNLEEKIQSPITAKKLISLNTIIITPFYINGFKELLPKVLALFTKAF